MRTMLLLLLIIVLAAAAGILGDLLEFALWVIGIMIAAGALLGYLVYRWFVRTKERLFDRR